MEFGIWDLEFPGQAQNLFGSGLSGLWSGNLFGNLFLNGRFILIKYFAVRDEKGNYKETLEVTQDITEIRELQGEKRLLDWE